MLLSGEVTKGGNIAPLPPISIYTHQGNLRISKPKKGMARRTNQHKQFGHPHTHPGAIKVCKGVSVKVQPSTTTYTPYV